jgi:hypothetical protein
MHHTQRWQGLALDVGGCRGRGSGRHGDGVVFYFYVVSDDVFVVGCLMVNTNIYSTVALTMGNSQTDPAAGKSSMDILPSKIKQNSNESLTFVLPIKGLKFVVL